MNNSLHQKAERGIALFDLDGTLIAWDTQCLFCDHVLRQFPLRRSFLPLFASFLPLAGLLGDEGMKRVFLSYLAGLHPGDLATLSASFAPRFFPSRCYPEVLSRLHQHQAAGHLTILASASPEIYLLDIGHTLGFDLILGTPVETPSSMPLFPSLSNHKGQAKVDRLLPILGTPKQDLWQRTHAYSDSTADLPMLLASASATVINPSPRLSAIASQHHWDSLYPQKPWRNRWQFSREMLRRLTGHGTP